MRALVLAAGFGTRLGGDTLKPLLDVGGRPLTGWVLANLAAHGIVDVAVNLHHRPDEVRAALGDGSRFGVGITYLEEPELLGTAGAVANARGFLAGGDFLVHYGDVVTDHDLGALAAAHRDAATILVHRRARSNSVVEVDDDGLVTSFLERPTGDEPVDTGGAWVFSGVCIGSPELLDLVPTSGDLPRDVFPGLAERGRLRSQPLAGYRCAVDSPDRLAEARRDATAGKVAIR